MKLSYVIVTYNRREPLLRTLDILHRTTPLPSDQWEAWVVDNASTDGSLDAVRAQYPNVHIIACHTNEGVGARSRAFAPARGQYLILLDDDSYPIGDTVTQSIDYLDTHPHSAAVVGKVILPDGSLEACAMPTVMLSGAVCLRKSVLTQVGGFRPEFFRKAGEYDLSFRIWQAGYTVDRFEDVCYRHDKVMTGRSAPFAHRMDLRNNLILVERYLPEDYRKPYRQDYAQRYSLIAKHADCGLAALQARGEALIWAIKEESTGRQTLSPAAIEVLFEHDSQYRTIKTWATAGRYKTVVLADFSKTIYATYQACQRAGLKILAVADDNPAFANRSYRKLPILPLSEAAKLTPDAVVLTNINPAQVDRRITTIASHFTAPTLRLWHPRYIADALPQYRKAG